MECCAKAGDKGNGEGKDAGDFLVTWEQNWASLWMDMRKVQVNSLEDLREH